MVTGRGFLFFALMLMLSSLAFTANANLNQDEEVHFTMVRELTINEYGTMMVNDTIILKGLVPKFEVTYPTQKLGFSAELVGYEGQIERMLELKKVVDNNSTTIIFSPKAKLPARFRENTTIKLELYLGGLVRHIGNNTYSVLMPLVPDVNLTIRAESILNLSNKTSFIDTPEGFSKLNETKRNVWKASWQKIEPALPNKNRLLRLMVNDTEFTILRLIRAERFIDTNAWPFQVIERLLIVNEGAGEPTSLKLSLLDPSLTRVKVIPSGEPPLFRAFTIELFEGSLQINEGVGLSLRQGESMALALQYPLPQEYVVKDDGRIELSVPAKPVLKAIADEVTVSILGDKYHLLKGEKTLKGLNLSPLTQLALRVQLRPKLAFGVADVFPVASAVFIAAILATVFSIFKFQMEKKREGRILVEKLEAALQDKVAYVQGLLDSLRRAPKLSRKELERSKLELDGLKSRLTKMAELKSSLLSYKPTLKQKLTELERLERDFDRLASELFHTYREYLSGRLKKEVLERHEKELKKRLNGTSDALLSKLEALMEEAGA